MGPFVGPCCVMSLLVFYPQHNNTFFIVEKNNKQQKTAKLEAAKLEADDFSHYAWLPCVKHHVT